VDRSGIRASPGGDGGGRGAASVSNRAVIGHLLRLARRPPDGRAPLPGVRLQCTRL